ncbi:TatD family hydrolase [Candidatus Roizmanbacteria bacterium]|nr:TatD family hydrolase [Candidatus Roizmanbacteria bacterium]
MFFDTHCHLNFKAFDRRVDEVINQANKVGVDQIVIPGTDVETSEKAIEIAEKYDGIYAAVGIHPHHVFEIFKAREQNFLSPVGTLPAGNGVSQVAKNFIPSLSKLLAHPKVVAVGEVGIDRHIYQKTKYPDYKIEEEFVDLQKIFLKEQIKLAIKYDKSLILHNREAREDMFAVLNEVWDKKLANRSVFHCCEPDKTLLEFAQKHKMFIGVDGDITYYKEKQEFIKTVPLEMLVLETDSPFLMPRLLSGGRSSTRYNEPQNIVLIAEFIAKLKGIPVEEVAKITTKNARRLFKISNF